MKNEKEVLEKYIRVTNMPSTSTRRYFKTQPSPSLLLRLTDLRQHLDRETRPPSSTRAGDYTT
jgi:hypothetical protein